MKRIESKLTKIAELKAEIAALEELRKKLEADAIAELEQAGISTLTWEAGDATCKATVVYSSSFKIDGPALLEKLDTRVRNQVTVRVLDEKLLEDKVARGIIDINLVAKHTTETPRKPYVKITGMGK
jgi:hypothetical protein